MKDLPRSVLWATESSPAEPLRLWIIQVSVIVLTTQILSLGLRKIRQPKVIAEVIGGILLGPTACGRIPGFTELVFPENSRSYLSLVANIGLCLFLFLVGLEIDSGVIKRNARLSFTVAISGMIIPFGLGTALSVPLYHKFIDESIKFTHFMLFTGVAFSITAFPVLCRILTELKLLDTTVGIVVLSAGVGNDIVGWTLLALSVALVNADSGFMALWILLTCVGWTLFLLIPVKTLLHWLARRTGSIEKGPTMFFMTVTILILFGSAFMTDAIGVHAIFGAFLAGIIVPRQGGLTIALTEKLEDMVSIIFLPLYFTLSGLSTDLGLLDDSVTWAFTIAICVLAYSGKFGGCTIAARLAGFTWREASTIGSLMSCKGLVELIVLNVGLSAGILSPRVFSMFVLEALLLTFMTTPAVVLLYPPAMRVRVAAKAAHFDTLLNEEPTPMVREGEDEGEDKPSHHSVQDELERKERFLVVLDRIEHLPGIMALTQLIQPPSQLDFQFCSGLHCRATTTSSASSSSGPSHSKHRHHRHISHPQKHSQHHGVSSIPFTPYHDLQLSISALRLIEITDRTSAVMKYSSLATENLRHTDPLLSIFRTFVELGSGGGGSVELSSEVKMAAYNDLVSNIKDEAERKSTQMLLIPWLSSMSASHSSIHHQSGEGGAQGLSSGSSMSSNPFETLFRSAGSDEADQASGFPFGDSSTSALHSRFIRSVFGSCGSDMDIALYIDQESTMSPQARKSGGNYHLFLPFFGGPDDRLALEFVVQLCLQNPRISATVVRVSKQDDTVGGDEDSKRPVNRLLDPRPDDGERHMRDGLLTAQSTTYGTFPDDTVYSGNMNTQVRLQSEMADNILWTRYTIQNTDPVPRITFDDLSTPTPLRSMIQQIHTHLPQPQPHSQLAGPSENARLLVICGRSRRLAVESHGAELKVIMDEHKSSTFSGLVSKTAGDTAAAIILSGIRVDLVVLQAASRSLT